MGRPERAAAKVARLAEWYQVRIYKYPIRITDEQTILLPKGAQPLSIGYQSGDIMLWCLIDPDAEKAAREIRVVGTGHDFEPTGWQYLGSAWWTPPFVWHVWLREAS